MKLKRVEVHNVLGVKDCDFTLTGHHVWLIGGRNRSGKTSALKAIAMAICGKRGQDFPDRPLHAGEKNGWIKVWTDNDLLIHRSFKKKGDTVDDKLRVTDESGDTIKEPQKILTKLFETVGFDPLAFSKAQPREQLERLRSIVPVETDDIDAHIQESYDDRKIANRLIKDSESEKRPEIPENTPDELIRIESLTDELKAIQEHNKQREIMSHQLDAVRKDVDQYSSILSEFLDRIKELESELSSAKTSLANAQRQKELHLDRGEELSRVLDEMKPRDDSDVMESIRAAAQVNENVHHKSVWNRHLEVLRERRNSVDGFTEKITLLGQERSERFEKADWPVEGLSYDETGVTFRGLPFKQCSYSESIDVSIEMGIALNPNLKLFIIQHGESFDDQTMAKIEATAAEKDYQFLIEYVTKSEADEERCQVIMVEGTQRQVEV